MYDVLIDDLDINPMTDQQIELLEKYMKDLSHLLKSDDKKDMPDTSLIGLLPFTENDAWK